jgi:N-acetylneuraminic acid mutarotase
MIYSNFSLNIFECSFLEWTTTGSMNNARHSHTASVLKNGKVLVTGGASTSFHSLNSVELYDPLTGIWTTTDDMNDTRHYHTASVLSNGKVLVTGGPGHIQGCEKCFARGYSSNGKCYQY